MPARGSQRREQLVEAGVALLAGSGPAAVTTRAVAERAGANVGPIHYRFGGAGPQRAAIAHRACTLAIDSVADTLLAASGEGEAADVVRHLLPDPAADAPATALATHLVIGAVQDPEFTAVLAERLRQVRQSDFSERSSRGSTPRRRHVPATTRRCRTGRIRPAEPQA